ncbi:hypothetical protein BUALT_Bualt02G0212000 [Buddleja alternifolia]|uniref:Uncharacterized protein n=1 Tax=Buddleja alternifolia TaxID=168488 RepID=A0AAV6YCV0_9LAMI|nr:hypothetical protein BUALT_Bualt02G0212000 [Buddleja alternifolia]
MAAAALKATPFLQLKNNFNIPECRSSLNPKSLKFKSPMATLTNAPTVGLSETFSRLKQQGKGFVDGFFEFLNLDDGFVC